MASFGHDPRRAHLLHHQSDDTYGFLDEVSGAITVSSTETIEAIAVAQNYSQSAVATADYTIVQTAATPTFTPAAGTYGEAQLVAIASATPGATIYYTTNGATPTTSATRYSGPVAVNTI